MNEVNFKETYSADLKRKTCRSHKRQIPEFCQMYPCNFEKKSRLNRSNIKSLENLHIRYVLEDKSLIEFRVEILPVHLGLIFRFFVWQKIKLDKRIRQSCRPIRGGKI